MEENSQEQPNTEPKPELTNNENISQSNSEPINRPESISPESASPSTEPVIAPEIILPSYKAPRDPKMVRVVAGGIIALVVVIGFAILLKGLNGQVTSPTTEPATSNNTTEKKESSITENEKQTLVKNVLTEIKTILPENDSNYKIQDVYDTTFPSYLANGAKTAMPLEKSFGIVITTTASQPEEFVKQIATDARAKIIKQGFVEYKDVEQDISGNHGWINKDKKIICTPILDNTTSFSISCGHTSWISTESVALGNSLAEAYKSKEGEYPAYINAKPSNIENSPYRPYQKITATMYDSAGLFYRPSSDASWVFFKSTQNTLPCSDYYADTGARHAFQGDVCLDKKSELATVTEGN